MFNTQSLTQHFVWFSLLQVVSFLHTVLLCDKLDFRTALVVCPLNTALNWLNEFEKWQEGLEDDERLEVQGLKGS